MQKHCPPLAGSCSCLHKVIPSAWVCLTANSSLGSQSTTYSDTAHTNTFFFKTNCDPGSYSYFKKFPHPHSILYQGPGQFAFPLTASGATLPLLCPQRTVLVPGTGCRTWPGAQKPVRCSHLGRQSLLRSHRITTWLAILLGGFLLRLRHLPTMIPRAGGRESLGRSSNDCAKRRQVGFLLSPSQLPQPLPPKNIRS